MRRLVDVQAVPARGSAFDRGGQVLLQISCEIWFERNKGMVESCKWVRLGLVVSGWLRNMQCLCGVHWLRQVLSSGR